MFSVGYEIFTRSVYFLTNTKHCTTFLALAQLFPVLLTHRPHTVKYIYYVAFCCISFRNMSFCVNNFITVFFWVLKVKLDLVILTFWTAISSGYDLENIPH